MPWKRGPDAVLCGSDAVEAWVGCRTPKTPILAGCTLQDRPKNRQLGAVRRPPNDMPGKIWSRARQNGLRMLPERGPDAVLCGLDAVEAWVGCRI
jgi:hypothetical protein